MLVLLRPRRNSRENGSKEAIFLPYLVGSGKSLSRKEEKYLYAKGLIADCKTLENGRVLTRVG